MTLFNLVAIIRLEYSTTTDRLPQRRTVADKRCIAYAFGDGVIPDAAVQRDPPCTNGMQLTTGTSCNVKCQPVGFEQQTAKVSCPDGLATDGVQAPTGQLTCVGLQATTDDLNPTIGDGTSRALIIIRLK